MSPSRTRAARELQGFLTHVTDRRASGPDAGAAAMVLDDLHAVAPSDCAMFMTPDAATRRAVTLANRDYPDAVRQLFEQFQPVSGAVTTGSRIPVRRRELRREQRIAQDRLETWGFHDGFNLALWAHDGRWVGSLVGSTLGTSEVDDETVDLLAVLAPSLASLLDPLPRPRPLSAELSRGNAEGLVVTRAGRTTAVTANAEIDLARRDGPLWPTIHPVLDGRDRWRLATILVGTRVLDVSVEADRHGALVLYRAIPAPYGLSVRELEVLDALSQGATNRALAARFAISPRTVATYVERLLAKTGCPNRTSAARFAGRLNLVVWPARAPDRTDR